MQKITSIIIDDEPTAIENLEILLASNESVNILKTFTSPEKALDWLIENQPDLIFLDVEMSAMTGFEFLDELEKNQIPPKIIFTTAYDAYALNAIKKSAFDYLLKPVSRKELAQSLRKLKKQIISHQECAPALKFKTRRGFVLLRTDDIFYVEADGNYCKIHKTNGSLELITLQIGKLTDLLPERDFTRISRKHIINCKYVAKVDVVSGTCRIEHDKLKADCKISKDKIEEVSKALI